MTWRTGCGAKAFRDVDAECGETTARACRCEGATQSSYRRLRDRLGLRYPQAGVPSARMRSRSARTWRA
jgi:hypothetical protein